MAVVTRLFVFGSGNLEAHHENWATSCYRNGLCNGRKKSGRTAAVLGFRRDGREDAQVDPSKAAWNVAASASRSCKEISKGEVTGVMWHGCSEFVQLAMHLAP